MEGRMFGVLKLVVRIYSSAFGNTGVKFHFGEFYERLPLFDIHDVEYEINLVSTRTCSIHN